MKKIYKRVLLAAIFALSTVGVEAKIIDLGIAAGTTISNYSIQGIDEAVDNSCGFQVGLLATVNLPIISVTPEIWYVQSKFAIEDTSEFKVKSVELPIVAGFQLFKILTLEAGPRFILYNNAEETTFKEGFDIYSPVGYVAGAKVTLMDKVFVGARYNGAFGTTDDYNIKSETITVMLGFKF